VKTLAAFLADVACVVVFSAAGRSQHGEASTLVGLWHTAWPFLLGLALAWAISLAWGRPFALLRTGLPVWIGTVLVGLITRVAFTDGGAAPAFVLVATGTLGALLLGWRIVVALVARARSWRRK